MISTFGLKESPICFKSTQLLHKALIRFSLLSMYFAEFECISHA